MHFQTTLNMIHKMRSILIFFNPFVLLFFFTIIIPNKDFFGQKSTVYFQLKKQFDSRDFFVGTRIKTIVSQSKKNGTDTSFVTEYTGLFSSSDNEGNAPLLKFERIEFYNNVNNQHYLHISSKNKLGILHLETGKLITPLQYNYIYFNQKDSLFLVRSQSESNLLNLKGEKINTVFFKKIMLNDIGYYDLMQTGTNAKIYNSKNEIIVDFGNVKIIEETYHENYFIIEKEGKYGIVNEKNEIKLPFIYSKIEYTEGENGEFYLASKTENKITLNTIVILNEDGNWKEVFPPDYSYISQINIYNNSSSSISHPIKDAVYYGINSQNKGVFLDNSGSILLTIEDAPKLYQASVLGDKFLQAYIDYTDYSLLYTLENGKLILGEGYYYQGKLPAPFDNFLFFNKEGKNFGTSFVNTVNYSTYFVNDYIFDFSLIKKELQAIFTMGEKTNHLLLFDLEKNIVKKTYSMSNYVEAEYKWWDQYNVVVVQDDQSKNGTLFIYDLVTDDLIYNGIQTASAYKLATSKIANQLNKELLSINPLNESLINLPYLTTVKNSDTNYSVFVNNDSIIIPKLTKKLDFEWLDFRTVFSIGSHISLSSYKSDDFFSYSCLFDDKLNLIMPFIEGQIINIVPTSTGNIVTLQYNIDSINYYNTSTKSFLYFNTVKKAINSKKTSYNFFDWLAFSNHLVIFEKEFHYIIDYQGKVLYKSNTINIENVGENYYLEIADENSKLVLLPSMQKIQVGESIVQEYDLYPYVFVKNGQDFYGLYDAQTGITVLNHEISSFATETFKEFIWLENKDGKFAIYNLKTNSIGKGYIYNSKEEATNAMISE